MATLLVVDDDLDVADIFSELLTLAGHDVRTANSAKEGLAAIHSERPECLLLDVDMPLQDGRQMAHEMLVHDAGDERIPILLLSNRVDLAAIAERMGTPYFLAKTAGSRRLCELLDRALRERTAPRQTVAPPSGP